MNAKHAAWSLVLLGATGCAKDDGSIWLLRFEPNTDDPDTYCTSDLTHNFNDVVTPDDAAEPLLTVTQELTQNASALLAQVTGGDEPVLVIGTRLWLGEKDGKTTTFTWDANETSSTDETGSAYAYTEDVDTSVVEKIKLEFDKDQASGTYTTTQTLNQAWTETDTWVQKDTGVIQGQIPAGQYLRVKAPGGKGATVPAHNTAVEVECAAPTCSLSTVQTCEVGVKVTATEVVADEGDYDQLDDVGRPAGVPDMSDGGGGGQPE
jgi:hypothetical protein